MKFTAIVSLSSMLIGLAIGYKLFNKQPELITKTETQTKVVRIIEPSGKIIETTEQISSNSKEAPKTAYKPQYSVGLLGFKKLNYVQAEARLGSLPLFIGAGVNIQNIDQSLISIKYEF